MTAVAPTTAVQVILKSKRIAERRNVKTMEMERANPFVMLSACLIASATQRKRQSQKLD